MTVSGIGSGAQTQVPQEEGISGIGDSLKGMAAGGAFMAMGLPPQLGTMAAGLSTTIQNTLLKAIPDGPGKDIVKFLFDPIGSLLTLLTGGQPGAAENTGYAAEAATAQPAAKPAQQKMLDCLDTLEENFDNVAGAHDDNDLNSNDYGITENDLKAIVSGQDYSPELKAAAAHALENKDAFFRLAGPDRDGEKPSMTLSELGGAKATLEAQLKSETPQTERPAQPTVEMRDKRRIGREEDIVPSSGVDGTAGTDEPDTTSVVTIVVTTTTTNRARTDGSSHTQSQGDHLENAAKNFSKAGETLEARMDQISEMMDKLDANGKYTEPPPSKKVWTTASLNAEMTKVSNRYQSVMSQVNALNTLISNVSKMYSDMQMNAIRNIN
jgi:hypothetical protein